MKKSKKKQEKRSTLLMANPTGELKPRIYARERSWLRSETMVVFRGRVLWAKERDRTSLVKTKTASLQVWWAGTVLPPTVFVGRNVCAVGKIRTYNGGKVVQITEAVPFKARYWTVMNPVYLHLWRFLEDPREWSPGWLIDKQRVEAYQPLQSE